MLGKFSVGNTEYDQYGNYKLIIGQTLMHTQLIKWPELQVVTNTEGCIHWFFKKISHVKYYHIAGYVHKETIQHQKSNTI